MDFSNLKSFKAVLKSFRDEQYSLSGKGYYHEARRGLWLLHRNTTSVTDYDIYESVVYKVTSSHKSHHVVVGRSVKNGNMIATCGNTHLIEGIKDTAAVGEALKSTHGYSDAELQRAFECGADAWCDPQAVCNYLFGGEKNCKHVKHILNMLANSDDLSAELDFLEAKPKPAAVVETDDSRMARYAFRKHVIFEGEKGGGKTYDVQKYIQSNDVTAVTILGNPAIEAIDLLGYETRTNAGLVWKDGKLSEAFRKAQAGQKVLVLIDEIARIPARELNLFVACGSPDINGNFRLPTGRVVDVEDGIGVMEELVAPESNLWFVGTMNSGNGYNVEELDPALKDRFRFFFKETTEATLRSILGQRISEKGWGECVLDALVSFWSGFNRLNKQGEISHPVNIRHLCEAVSMADTPEQVTLNLRDCVMNWVDRDVNGLPLESQVEFVIDLIPEL